MKDFKCDDTRDLDPMLTNFRANNQFYLSFNTNLNDHIVGVGDDMFEAQKDYHRKINALTEDIERN